MSIEVQALSFHAGGKRILDRVSMRIEPGETVALIGPNGAGKSTLLRGISGDLRATSGTVKMKGRALNTFRPRELAQYRTMLAQSIQVAFPFTVSEIVGMGGGDRRGKMLDGLVDAALAEVELSEFRDRLITTLSGGEQQRAHLARALVQLVCGEEAQGPGVLLLDEPIANLDLRHQIHVAGIARRRAARGHIIVTVVHDLNFATLFADRVVVLDAGCVVQDGTPQETITDITLKQVFMVASPVGHLPEPGVPFFLPQAALSLSENASGQNDNRSRV